MVLLGCTEAAQAASPEGPTLFINVNVFDGVSETLIKNANVVVTGNIITAVSTEDLAVAGGRVIDGGGRTLMPGLADTHVLGVEDRIGSLEPGKFAGFTILEGDPFTVDPKTLKDIPVWGTALSGQAFQSPE